MHVTALLEAKGHEVVTVEESIPIGRAIDIMGEHGIGALVVTGAATELAGIISERDVVRHLAQRGAAILDQPVSALMSSSVTTCEPQTSVTSLMGIMTEHRIRHVPVIEHGHLVGIVSIGDVVKARLDELERERRDLLDYVSAR